MTAAKKPARERTRVTSDDLMREGGFEVEGALAFALLVAWEDAQRLWPDALPIRIEITPLSATKPRGKPK